MKQVYKTFSVTGDNLKYNAIDNSIKNGVVKNLFNVDISEGEILSKLSLVDFAEIIEPSRSAEFSAAIETIVGTVIGIYYYDSGRQNNKFIIFCNSQFQLFYYQICTDIKQIRQFDTILLTSKPSVMQYIIDGKNMLFITSPTDEMWVWDGEENPYKVLDAPKVKSFATAFDRLFVVPSDSLYSIYFSDEKDLTNWTMSAGDAGVINFSDNLGKVICVFNLDNYLYVVREFGITKITRGREDNEFVSSLMYMSTQRIYSDSVCCVGDYIMFVCPNGIYRFDGLSAKLCYKTNFIAGGNVPAICKGNYYYILLSSEVSKLYLYNIEDSTIDACYSAFANARLGEIIIDNENIIYILCNKIENANCIKCIVNNDTNTPNNAEFIFTTSKINPMPSARKKALCGINVLTYRPIKLTVYSGYESKTCNIYGAPIEQLIQLPINFDYLKFEITGKNASIANLSFKYSYVSN